MSRVPLVFRKFAVDFIETLVPSMLGLTAISDRDALLHAAAIAVGAAFVSAARRNASGLKDFLAQAFGVAAA